MGIFDGALEFAKRAHGKQVRKYTHDPYWVHLVEVAQFCQSVGESDDVVNAAYLHDTIEDTPTKYAHIAAEFGERVAHLVMQVTDVSRPEIGNRALRKAVDRQYLAGASDDAKSIKLADMISNTKSVVEGDIGFAKIYLPEKRLLLRVLGGGNRTLMNLASETLLKAEIALAEAFDTPPYAIERNDG
jgi:hypothetical protein